MKITQERWVEAQESELLDHLETLKNSSDSVYHYGQTLVFGYVNLDLKNDLKDKVIVEVGSGPKGSILLAERNFKKAIAVEPLIDKFPPNIREDYEKMGVEVICDSYEDVELGMVDETWFFNVLQHVKEPKKILEKAKNTSHIVRIFEPINYPANTCHPHVLTEQFFEDVFGKIGNVYKGGSQSGFHTSDCYYAVWEK